MSDIQCVPLVTEPHFFNNSNTNEETATKFEQGYVPCVRNEVECVCSVPNCCDTEQRSKYPGFVSEWDNLYKTQCLEGSSKPVPYTGCTVAKGLRGPTLRSLM
jgi:hypothetical protein